MQRSLILENAIHLLTHPPKHLESYANDSSKIENSGSLLFTLPFSGNWKYQMIRHKCLLVSKAIVLYGLVWPNDNHQ